MGDTTLFQKMVDATFDSSKTAFEVSLGLTGVLALWLGIMKIGEKGGHRERVGTAVESCFHQAVPRYS